MFLEVPKVILTIIAIWKQTTALLLRECQVRLREKGKSRPMELHGERHLEVGKDLGHLFKCMMQFWPTQ